MQWPQRPALHHRGLGRAGRRPGLLIHDDGEAVELRLRLVHRRQHRLDILHRRNPARADQRLANGPADAKITDITGSGPFIFRKDEWKSGDRMVLARNPAYIPRPEKPDFLAGGKVVHLDTITLKVIQDVSTAASALIAGEIDYLQYVPFDWIFRLNHANPPFNDPAIRQVLWNLVDQKSILEAIGIPPEFRVDQCSSYWMCGTPLESKAGAEVFRYDIEAAKAALKKTAYKGEPVVFMELPNSPTSMNPALVVVDAMRKAGFTVDEQPMEWATLLQRRAKKDTWSMFAVYSNGVDMSNPLTHFYVAANCADFAGWSCDPAMKPLITDFVKAPDDTTRKTVADRIQALAFANTPSVMWGQFTVPTGYRTSLSGLVESSFPMFWQVEKK